MEKVYRWFVALALAGAGLVVVARTAEASHDGSYCETVDSGYVSATPQPSAHTEAECAALNGGYGYNWFPASAPTTTTAAPTTTTTAAPATTTTTAAPTPPTVLRDAGAVGVYDPAVRMVSVWADIRPMYAPYRPGYQPEMAQSIAGAPDAEGDPGHGAGGWRIGTNYDGTWGLELTTTGPVTTPGRVCAKRSDGPFIYLGFWAVKVRATNFNESKLQPGYPVSSVPSYMWRVSADFTGSINNDVCAAMDPGPPGTPPGGLGCERTNSGSTFGLKATVLNPRPGAVTDEVFLKFPWEAAERAGPVASGVIAPLEGMPVGGWPAYCRLKRTLEPGATGSQAYKNGALWRDDLGDTSMWKDYRPGSDYAEAVPNLPGGPQAWIPTLVTGGGGLRAWPPPPGINMPTVVGVPAAAWTGWMLGGAASGIMEWLGVDSAVKDEEFACKWNPGYKAVRQSTCQAIANRPELRRVVQLGVCATPSGASTPECNPVGKLETARWTQSQTYVEVIIDPTPGADQRKGRIGTAAAEFPQLRTSAGTGTAENPAVDDYPSAEKTPGAEQNPEPAMEETLSSSSATPPPPEEGTGGCRLSFWEAMNPWNIAETMGCILQKLFVPGLDVFDGLQESWAGVASLVGHPVSVINASVSAFVPDSNSAGCEGPVVTMPAIAGSGSPGWTFRPLNNCSGPMKTASDLIRPVLLAMIWLGTVKGSYEVLAAAILGGRTTSVWTNEGSDGGAAPVYADRGVF